MATYQENYEQLKVMRFSVGTIGFAIAITEIREVISPTEIRKIPKAPNFIEGVLSLRGEIIPVVDLRRLFEVDSQGTDYRIILRAVKGVTIGYMVDQVSNVVQIEKKNILPRPPVIIQGLSKECIYGLFDQEEDNVLLIDLSKAISGKEVEALNSLVNQHS
ncbi:MAG: hypothetical protein A2600_08420 [Candidatus Lambdaproteobacteria bacterium RIFOXYD1_FULL_56_27]|uniref:CheW-like domain-containing protein n=1 Tax=Candidatus Lambdaproteobacteria bacterium RIFOXYD2_FULL_56_26 TaxID=1817773 RepID=A0A1F6H0J9_9PROT|nr:MAG: hypothetical protein A2426_06660 [Candidatus Lambdaproteobacteria bacterium RIFOXYC1_FULL_56_13]OGH03810.1 MAG: hypothetical protein A2557_13750 [Candidatus Lambdaproteobacteria bacterium RIFOXYD2_FULL_56_26]OGH08804.1 MAG: hypothetical protein A2600_08420 [Candidatus Lambdaproteobacteria bacterium RIFOXYD1_FULL_56_27]